MRPPPAVASGRCTIVGEQNLPASLGGARAVCAVIEKVITDRVPAVPFTLRVTVLPRSRLAGAVTVNGRALPEQKFAVMDRELNGAAIRQFADGLAEQIAKASSR